MNRLYLASLSALVSCYNPDLSGVKYTCEEANPVCPDGLACRDGVCADPSAPVDPGPVDPGPQGAAGCKSTKGHKLSPTAYACPGTFGYFGAAGLCATGYSVCGRDLAAAALTECAKLDGFFVSTVKAWRGNKEGADDAVCMEQAGMGKDRLLLAGCGAPKSNTGIAKDLSTDSTRMCAPFVRAVDCGQSNDGWGCGDGRSTNSWINDRSSTGILCCATK